MTSEEERILAGQQGEAKRIALSLVTQIAEVCEADRLIPVSRVHIGGSIYDGDAGLEFTEMLVRHGGRFCVPTSVNMVSVDLQRWPDFKVGKEFGEKASRLARSFADMGAEPTWTCAPYETPSAPKLGDQIAAGESNVVAYYNSVIGARTNRYGDLLDVCVALAGRAPEYGLHLTENRKGQALFRLRDISAELMQEGWFYAALGYFVGRVAGDRIPVIDGAPPNLGYEGLKAFGAAAASSGAVGLFHVVGVTPEAPDLSRAMGGCVPQETFEVTTGEIQATREKLSTNQVEKPDLVAIGCPHLSLSASERLVDLLKGRRVSSRNEFWVFTNRFTYSEMERRDLLRPLLTAGVRVTTDTCPLNPWILEWRFRSLMTNSGKLAHYAPGTVGLDARFGSLTECVAAGTVAR